MATKISWAAAIAFAGSTFIAAGCRTTEEKPAGSSAPAASAPSEPRQSSSGDRASATAEATPSGATAMSPYELTGRVEKLDRSTVQIAGKTLKIDSSTSVKKGGVGAELNDVKEGDQVRASLTGSGDQLKAERIEVMSPAGGGTREPGKSSQQSGSTGTGR